MRQVQGVTLIELMIAVVVVGILTTVAYPSYISYIIETRRTEAMQELYEAANLQEQYYLDEGTYTATIGNLYGTTDSTMTTVNGYYTLASTITSVAGGDSTDTFTLTATATSLQDDDTCVSMSLDETGTRSALDSDGGDSSDKCWD